MKEVMSVIQSGADGQKHAEAQGAKNSLPRQLLPIE
jgi:hypothetical protein